MRPAQKRHAINLLLELYSRDNRVWTITELCKLMSLKRSPYAVEIIDWLVGQRLLEPNAIGYVNGLRTQLLEVPQDDRDRAQWYIDCLENDIQAREEVGDDELPF